MMFWLNWYQKVYNPIPVILMVTHIWWKIGFTISDLMVQLGCNDWWTGQWKSDLYIRMNLEKYGLGLMLADANQMLKSKTQSAHLHCQ